MNVTLPSSLDCFRASPFLSTKHTTYFSVYDRLFSPYRDRPITFVEIGVLSGGSLFMWRKFFGAKARIIGIDLNPDAVRWREHGFEIHIGSQADPAFWQSFLEDVGPIDILLDDGGHRFEQQIMTCECALPGIRDGGLLVVEDTHTSYLPSYGGPSPMSFINFAKQIADGINHRFSGLHGKYPSEAAIWSVRFFESLVAFEVDRKLAGLASRPCRNNGAPIPALDYRDRDEISVTAAQLISAFRY
ncbi:class I SAM-dependent methyltransferase [Phaeobacter sp. SYSU ZJ3003]|uniref:class I SAM-dependent methyltransferase n=1 Tax=Phaeobacter sp. SYSU ZJ3003 TaxID=2109330 RepID=UPI00351C3F89